MSPGPPFIAILSVLLLSAPVRAAWPPGEVVAFGVVVGRNDGGDDLVRLRYAARDAEKVRDTFIELGRMAPERIRTVLDGDVDDVRQAIRDITRQIENAHARGQSTLFLFYYSGHAQDQQLLLGRTRLPMRELKSWIENMHADIRVAFIDSCQSGELTRMKGGTLAPSMVDLDQTSGHVIVTSSSAGEGSQESDEIGGSFFTHYLVSGLRGAADTSGDGAVSLQEIYEFTYNRTINRTASTQGGIQHPTYGYQLAGHGQVLLTFTGGQETGILFPTPLTGTYLVYDLDKKRIVAEVSKVAGQPQFIAVKAGTFAIKKRRQHDLLLGQIDLRAGDRWTVQDEALEVLPFENDVTKGLVAVSRRDWQVAYALRLGGEAFFDAPTREDLFYSSPQAGLQVTFHDLIARHLSLSMDVHFGGGEDDTRLQLEDGSTQAVPATFFRFEIGAQLAYHLDWRYFGLYAGPRLTFMMTSRHLKGVFSHYPDQSFGTLSPGLTLGVCAHLGDWDLFAEGRAHYLYYNVGANQSLGFGGAYLGLAYRH